MNTDVETRLRATLDEQAGATERLDVGSLADQVMARGRVLRRRRAMGAAAAAVLVVGAILAVPTWVAGEDQPTHSYVASPPPKPPAASASSTPSQSATRELEPSMEEMQTWLDSLPDLPGVPGITGDASPVLLIVPSEEGSTGAEVWKATARLVATGQVLATGDPHGAALDTGGDRLAVAMEQGVGGRRDGAVTLMVFTADTGTLLTKVSGLQLGTFVRGWLDGRVVLDVYTDGNRDDKVLLWDPEKPHEALIEVADGHAVDVAEAGHRILIEEPGGACVRVWQITGEPKPVIEDCGARLAAISDDGQAAFAAAKFGVGPIVLDLRTGVQTEVQVPWPWVGAIRWSNDDRLVMHILAEPDEESPVVVCEPSDGQCARVVPIP